MRRERPPGRLSWPFRPLGFDPDLNEMTESFQNLLERMFVGPVYPASILVCLLILYTMVALVGLIELDVDLPEADFDFDMSDGVDLDFFQGIGAASLRWMNLGRIPIILWGGLFTVVFWSLSYGIWHRFDSLRYEPTFWTSALLVGRNAVISVVGTKLLTQPLVKYFVPLPSYASENLIGGTCEISSLEATPDFGTAKFRTEAAPLLLNVRTDGPTFEKGDEVRIIDFDPKTRLYKICSLDLETK